MKLKELIEVLENVDTIVIKSTENDKEITFVSQDMRGQNLTEKLEKFYSYYHRQVERLSLKIDHKPSIEATIYINTQY